MQMLFAASATLEFGLDTLRDLPEFEALENARLLSKDKPLAGGCSTRFLMKVRRPQDSESAYPFPGSP
jgi:segregation and condensation protein B